MTGLERVKKVIEWLIFDHKVKSRRELAKKMGYTESSLSQILNEKVALSDRFINKLATVDYAINVDWLRTGEGNMLKNEALSATGLNHYSVKENDANYGEDAQIWALKQEVDHLTCLLLEKDKQLAEKERLIDLLMKRSGN